MKLVIKRCFEKGNNVESFPLEQKTELIPDFYGVYRQVDNEERHVADFRTIAQAEVFVKTFNYMRKHEKEANLQQ